MATRDLIFAAAGAAGGATYVEDVFSTYLYTGTGSNQTITNGIDLSGEGGLVWQKGRSSVSANTFIDTVRGGGNYLTSNTDNGQISTTALTFSSTGFTTQGTWQNTNAATYVGWTFRKAKKFFDVVTYTGTGSATTIAHNLGSVPGMIIIKNISSAGVDWVVYHRSIGNTKGLYLNSTSAEVTNSSFWNNTTPTSTVFSIGDFNTRTNLTGDTYVAYLFAHDAGGFGSAGTDNIISCGSFTCPSSGGVDVNLGYEPQYILTKKVNSAENWNVWDIMRGWGQTHQSMLFPNLSNAEYVYTGTEYFFPTATGFRLNSSFGLIGDYIYMAIRRGPMKTPTSGTSVFSPIRETSSSNPQTLTTGFPVDLTINTLTDGQPKAVMDRLRGGSTTFYNYLNTTSTAAEATGSSAGVGFDNNTGIVDNNWWINPLSIYWNFRRAPGFFDQVCYTGNNGVATTQAHNLGVAPELMIIKGRNIAEGWQVYVSSLGNTKYLQLNIDSSEATATNRWNSTSPTSTVFSLGTSSSVNWSNNTYVAYLFATVAGVSKVGSYTGTGSTQTINAGLPTGARFVLIKRTDSTGDWWVWDTARGMVAGTDPRLALNDQNAQINNDWVLTTSTGFQIVTSDATVNASGGSYIYLAIA